VPDRFAFGYTFDHLADVVDGLPGQLGIDRFAIYVMDFGAAVGFRLALRHPERLSAIVVQNAPLHPWEPQGWWATLGLGRRVARGCLTPGLPQIPCVTVSRHTARVVLIVRTTRPMPSGRRRWGPGG
jgi:pimeloyl-ACP methyl ester carboxylesterase